MKGNSEKREKKRKKGKERGGWQVGERKKEKERKQEGKGKKREKRGKELLSTYLYGNHLGEKYIVGKKGGGENNFFGGNTYPCLETKQWIYR